MKQWTDLLIRSLILGLLIAIIVLFAFPNKGAKLLYDKLFSDLNGVNSHISFASAVNKAGPTVVSIYTERVDPDTGAKTGEQGSGVLIDNLGHVVTNYHVIKDAVKVGVIYTDGILREVKIIGVDERTDLAVVATRYKNAPHVDLSNQPDVLVGDIVIAIGNPHGIGQSVSMGIVSGKGRVRAGKSFEQFIQTDAAINPGNSGGGLFDINGNLVGITSAFFSTDSNGISFAIPVSLVKFISDKLIQNGKFVRGWLGVDSGGPMKPIYAQKLGLLGVGGIVVGKIAPGSPADKAGLQKHDIILRINGKRVGEVGLFIQWLSRMEPGTDLILEVLRIDDKGNRKNLQLPVTLIVEPKK